MNKFYIYTLMMTALAVGAVCLTGCSVVPVVEHPNRANVLEENFTTEAKALNHELDTYDELMPLYPDDSEQALLEAAVTDFLSKDDMVSREKLKVETMDLQLYEGDDNDVYFAAVMQNKEKLPFTMLAQMKAETNKRYEVKASCLAPYYANLPKTFLLKEGKSIAVVSQRPFSTFEEVYFYKLDGGKLALDGRGWQDVSLAYYSTLNELLDANQLEEAMNLPDESMYPMAYEAMLFATANKIIDKTVAEAKNEKIDPKLRTALLDWGINYYMQNHYGQGLDEMISSDFEALSTKEEVFGKDYLLPVETIRKSLALYANLRAKTGDEVYAESLLKAIEAIPMGL